MKGEYWNTAQLAVNYGSNIALIEKVNSHIRTITYSQLEQLVIEAKRSIQVSCGTDFFEKKLVMIVATNTIESVVYYLAAMQLSHVVWWVDKNSTPERLKQLQQHYAVNLFIDNDNVTLINKKKLPLHNDLALLITTSGSTGSPTLVRLNYKNLSHNCNAICNTLSLTTTDATITTLPLQYSFGLSIVNTHIYAGSTIILSEEPLISREFWSLFKECNVQCLYGVPHSFDMLLKLSFSRLPFKSLRFMAVAGGKLSQEKVSEVNDYCRNNKSQFYVMYGQTEATARISVLSPEKIIKKPFSIGQAISGNLWLEDESGNEINAEHVQGELCYRGDNVMMGIAKALTDLSLPSEISVLHTGDLAQFDCEGDFQITGRLKRIIKVVGHRVNLDEIEDYLAKQNLQVACTGQDDMVHCYLLESHIDKAVNLKSYQTLLSQYLSLHSNYFNWITVEQFPYLSSGKLNYPRLDKMRLVEVKQ